MAFVIEDDDQDGFGRVGGGGGGGGDYDIDLGDIPAPRARAAASGNRAKASGRGGAGAAASSSTAADATGGVAASAPASVTDKARYYLAKIKADKARWEELGEAGGRPGPRFQAPPPLAAPRRLRLLPHPALLRHRPLRCRQRLLARPSSVCGALDLRGPQRLPRLQLPTWSPAEGSALLPPLLRHQLP